MNSDQLITIEPKIDLETCYFVQCDWFSGHWNRVPIAPLQQALEQEKNVLLFDLSAKKHELFPLLRLEEYVGDKHDDLAYKYLQIKGDEENSWEISPYTTQLLHKFHYSWLNTGLSEYLHNPDFKRILATVKQFRSFEPVYPRSEDMFTAFLHPSFDQIKCVWMGLSPYPSNHANGRAFASYQKETPVSLQIIQDAIRSSMQLGIIHEFDNSLVSLSNQGVLFLNAAFTTTADPRKHLEIWRLFTEQVFQVLRQKPDLTYVLFGKEAQSFVSLIPSHHTVYTLNHPSWFARTGKPMITDVFVQLHQKLGIQY